MTNNKIFIRVNEVCELFSISRSHCWNLISTGQLKVFRPSSKVTLIKVDDLISYIEGTCLEDTDENI
tara:strand:- start:2069 stop:2269 length:201 start_codon:yes stop_codon:yes gene_type:complete